MYAPLYVLCPLPQAYSSLCRRTSSVRFSALHSAHTELYFVFSKYYLESFSGAYVQMLCAFAQHVLWGLVVSLSLICASSALTNMPQPVNNSLKGSQSLQDTSFRLLNMFASVSGMSLGGESPFTIPSRPDAALSRWRVSSSQLPTTSLRHKYASCDPDIIWHRLDLSCCTNKPLFLVRN